MSGGIYLLRGEDELLEMTEQPYDSEEILQALIARFPSLLAGDQYRADVPRRWLLIGREAALPDEQDGGGRWSVDHLFLDQDAVPTLVEVKRSSDTRIRREVIGQMLDYAANAVVYWPVERLRELLMRQAGHVGREADELVADAALEQLKSVLQWVAETAASPEPRRSRHPHPAGTRRRAARAGRWPGNLGQNRRRRTFLRGHAA